MENLKADGGVGVQCRCGQMQQSRCSFLCLSAGEDSSLSPATISLTMTVSGTLACMVGCMCIQSVKMLREERKPISYVYAFHYEFAMGELRPVSLLVYQMQQPVY